MTRRRPSDDEVIAAYCDEKLTAAEVGDRFGYSRGWVIKRLKANDIERRPRGGGKVRTIDHEAEADLVAHAVALYVDEDLDMAEVSRRTGQSRWWVKDRLTRQGITTVSKRSGSNADAQALERIRRMYVEQRLSLAAIAEEVAMSATWVGRQLFEVLEVTPRTGRLDVDEALIEQLYVQQRLSMRAIADQIGVSDAVVRRVLTERGITIRGRSEARTTASCEELRRLYVNEQLSTGEIAERLGLSPSGVNGALHRCEIPTRKAPVLKASNDELRRHLDAGLSNEEIADRYGVATWAVTRRLRAEKLHRPQPKPDYTRPSPPIDELVAMYVDDEATLAEIATHYGVPHPTVGRWLDNAGIQRRRTHSTASDAGDRVELTAELLEQLYTNEQLTAAAVGRRVGVTKNVVLKALHHHRIPVRPPGPRRPAQEPLLDRLYDDATITAVLTEHNVPLRRQAGTLQERFPDRQPLTDQLVRALYVDIGLSIGEVSLITGHDHLGVRAALQQAHIAARAHGRSPWTAAGSV